MSTQPEQRPRLGERVRAEIRAEMGRQMLSQVALAVRLGEAQPWVSRRLYGATPITLDDLERMAAALGHDVAYFLVLPRLDSNQQPADQRFGHSRLRVVPPNVIEMGRYRRQPAAS